MKYSPREEVCTRTGGHFTLHAFCAPYHHYTAHCLLPLPLRAVYATKTTSRAAPLPAAPPPRGHRRATARYHAGMPRLLLRATQRATCHATYLLPCRASRASTSALRHCTARFLPSIYTLRAYMVARGPALPQHHLSLPPVPTAYLIWAACARWAILSPAHHLGAATCCMPRATRYATALAPAGCRYAAPAANYRQATAQKTSTAGYARRLSGTGRGYLTLPSRASNARALSARPT